MNQEYIKEYYRLQYESFCDHVKAVADALEKIFELNNNQVSDRQRNAVKVLKALYSSQIIEDIKRDLSSGQVTQDTVEKRVKLDMDACSAIMELLNPSPMGKILLELIIAEQANVMRTNLKNQILLLNNM